MKDRKYQRIAKLSNEARLSAKQFKYPESIAKWYEVVGIFESIDNHKEFLDYATSLNNLAALHQEMGEYEQALPLCKEAKEIYKKALGEQHPDYASSLNNLAALHQEMGEYEQALPLYKEAKEIRKKVLTEQHPDYAASLNNLAELHQEMGEYEQALPLYEQAIAILEKALGKNHPTTKTVQRNYQQAKGEAEALKCNPPPQE